MADCEVHATSRLGAGDATVREDCDLFSDTSSVSGSSISSTGSTGSSGSTGSCGSSGRSHGSSKNRRKHERKILSLKEGNPHEEGALVHALHTVITSTFALRDEVHETCRALIGFNLLDIARPVQDALIDILGKMELKFKVIWPPVGVIWRRGNLVNPETGPNPYEEMASLDAPYQYPPSIAARQWQFSLLKEDQIK